VSYVQKTFKMQAGVAFTVDLGRPCGKVTLTTKAETYARVDGGSSAPTALVASPAPAAGAAADYIHLATAGESISIGYDDAGAGLRIGLQDPLRYVSGWAIADGDLLVVGH